MFKVVLVVLVFLFSGCSKADKLNPGSAQEEVTTLAQEPSLPLEPVVEKVSLEAQEEPGALDAQEPASEDQIPDIAKIGNDEPKKAKGAAFEGVDAVINNGQWGFSIYNPEDKVTEYYNSNGTFLGKRQG